MNDASEGRYLLYGAIAAGGMATVHFGRKLGARGFSRSVAIKRLHAHLAADPRFVKMFTDEAMIAAAIRHPNVVPTLDVVESSGELLLVMDYVHAEALSRLMKQARAAGEAVPLPVVSRVVGDLLHGLHAAHEAKTDDGKRLAVVHRDVSPQNVLVGTDGVSRVMDFGIAKAVDFGEKSRSGELTGKLSYMAPEQVSKDPIDRRCDIYAAGIVLWEMLTLQRARPATELPQLIAQITHERLAPPSSLVSGISEPLDALTLRAVALAPQDRFATAQQMALALELAVPPASAMTVAQWVQSLCGEALEKRAAVVERIAKGIEQPVLTLGEATGSYPALPLSTPVVDAVDTNATANAHAKPARAIAIAMGALVVCVLGVMVYVGLRFRRESLATEAQAATSLPIPVASAAIPSTIIPTDVTPPFTPPALPAASTSASVTRRYRPPQSRPAPNTASSAPDCTIPYVFQNDVRVPKPECLHSH